MSYVLAAPVRTIIVAVDACSGKSYTSLSYNGRPPFFSQKEHKLS